MSLTSDFGVFVFLRLTSPVQIEETLCFVLLVRAQAFSLTTLQTVVVYWLQNRMRNNGLKWDFKQDGLSLPLHQVQVVFFSLQLLYLQGDKQITLLSPRRTRIAAWGVLLDPGLLPDKQARGAFYQLFLVHQLRPYLAQKNLPTVNSCSSDIKTLSL